MYQARKYQRIHHAIPVRITIRSITGEEQVTEGTLVDLSVAGAGVRLKRGAALPHAVRREVELELHRGRGRRNSLKWPGILARVQDQGDHHVLGVSFGRALYDILANVGAHQGLDLCLDEGPGIRLHTSAESDDADPGAW